MAEETSNPQYADAPARSGLEQELPAIECFENLFPGYEITIENPEYTAVCPKTGLPDFGTITIRYEPAARCLELKSLKEYFLAYRSIGIFYESAVNRILRDLVAAAEPVWMEIRGEFRPRGGIRSSIVARHGQVPVRNEPAAASSS